MKYETNGTSTLFTIKLLIMKNWIFLLNYHQALTLLSLEQDKAYGGKIAAHLSLKAVFKSLLHYLNGCRSVYVQKS